MSRQLQVDHHPTGGYTLKYREGRGPFTDYMETGLWTNSDAAGFYRAVAAEMGRLAAAGISFTYTDCNYD